MPAKAALPYLASVSHLPLETGKTLAPKQANLDTAPMFLCNVASVADLPNGRCGAEDLLAANERMSDTMRVDSDKVLRHERTLHQFILVINQTINFRRRQPGQISLRRDPVDFAVTTSSPLPPWILGCDNQVMSREVHSVH